MDVDQLQRLTRAVRAVLKARADLDNGRAEDRAPLSDFSSGCPYTFTVFGGAND